MKRGSIFRCSRRLERGTCPRSPAPTGRHRQRRLCLSLHPPSSVPGTVLWSIQRGQDPALCSLPLGARVRRPPVRPSCRLLAAHLQHELAIVCTQRFLSWLKLAPDSVTLNPRLQGQVGVETMQGYPALSWDSVSSD